MALADYSSLDIIVVVVPLLLATGAALYMRRFNRSVADFLAASRSAGRYLICTAQMEMGVTAMALVASMEVFSRTGFSLNLWSSFVGFSFFLLALSGLVTYRFRETRALTFHQFLEMRYSRGVRVYATILNVFSGLFTFGLAPGVAARFFVHFLGLPAECEVLGLVLPTFLPVMVVLMSLALFFAMSGGHLSVMVVDCLEGLISSLLYLVVAFAVLAIFSYDQMAVAFTSGQAGASFVDPFDVAKQQDFGYIYVLIGWAMTVYFWRGNTWNAAFAASARSAHEGQMATILGIWRGLGSVAMGSVVGIGAFVLLHNPEFAGQAATVQAHLAATIPDSDSQLRTQLALPTALGALLPMGVKGALCAIMLMGTIAGLSSGLFNFSTGFIQDVVLPMRGGRLEARTHIRVLRLAAFALAIFAVWFSCVFRIADFLTMVTALLSGIYLAGMGVVVWGGLYWRRATRAGAWTALLVGSILSLGAAGVQQAWPRLAEWGARSFAPGALHDLFVSHPQRIPVNGQILSASIMLLSLTLFVVVSLLTSRRSRFDLERMLHRDQEARPAGPGRRWSLAILAGINSPHFTRNDRIIAYGVFFFGLLSPVGAVCAIGWNACVERWSANSWWNWHFFWAVILPLAVCLVTLPWFTWGAVRDMRRLLRDLSTTKPDERDNGMVAAEAGPAERPGPSSSV